MRAFLKALIITLIVFALLFVLFLVLPSPANFYVVLAGLAIFAVLAILCGDYL